MSGEEATRIYERVAPLLPDCEEWADPRTCLTADEATERCRPCRLRAILDPTVPESRPVCDCYPGGFTASMYEGLREDCPVHGHIACRYCRHPLRDDQERRWGICGSCHDDGTASA